jgi:hypothetical protein
VFISGEAFGFPITRDVGDDFAVLCLHPSARDPTPIGVLLKTNIKPQFDRTVTDRSKSFFGRFCQLNRCHFVGFSPV